MTSLNTKLSMLTETYRLYVEKWQSWAEAILRIVDILENKI